MARAFGKSRDSNETHPTCEPGHTDLMDVVVTGSVQRAACSLQDRCYISGDAVPPPPLLLHEIFVPGHPIPLSTAASRSTWRASAVSTPARTLAGAMAHGSLALQALSMLNTNMRSNDSWYVMKQARG